MSSETKNHLNILFLGDIVGKPGRTAISEHLSSLKQDYNIDFVVANCDNASGGFGINLGHYKQLLSYGIDVLTSGDHVWDQKAFLQDISKCSNLIRPFNFPSLLPGKGHDIFSTENGYKIVVIHVAGQRFMKHNFDDPFIIKDIINQYKDNYNPDAILVDIHAETTSEKYGMGHFLDGEVSLVVGTHTHVPTSDTKILSKGTGFRCDLGMCGNYDSIIGMNKEVAIESLTHKVRLSKFYPQEGEATLSGIVASINRTTLLTEQIENIIVG